MSMPPNIVGADIVAVAAWIAGGGVLEIVVASKPCADTPVGANLFAKERPGDGDVPPAPAFRE
jgi:hypothetical protein